MNELMRDEILDQAHAIGVCLPVVREDARIAARAHVARCRRVVLAGSGDSYFAPLALQMALRTCIRAEVHVATALEAARYWSYQPGDILAAISISGESARVLEAARNAADAGAEVVAITSNGQSSLAQICKTPIVIPFRSRSRVTPHTTDYMTTLLALAAFAEALAEGDEITFLGQLARLVQDAVADLEVPCRLLGEEIATAESFYFVGAGPNWATAQYGAAKFWEAGGLRASAFDLEEFGHGAHLVVDQGDAIIVLDPAGGRSDRGRLLASSVQQLSAISIVISDAPAPTGVQEIVVASVDEMWSPFLMCIPVQWISWSVATAKRCDVLTKDGRHSNAKDYEALHWQLVRD